MMMIQQVHVHLKLELVIMGNYHEVMDIEVVMHDVRSHGIMNILSITKVLQLGMLQDL